MPTLSIRVPASTSNLGPGFDQLGLCLSLWLEVELEELGRRGLEVEAPTDWPAPGEDLLWRALQCGAGASDGGLRERGLRLRISSEVPIGRGLGSTGAAVAAGLRLGRALAGHPAVDPASLVADGIALEGHPDNITASLLGGLTTCVPLNGDAPAIVRHPVHPSVGLVACWPPEPLETARARAALPDTVPFAVAVENARRLPVLLEGLREGDPRLIRIGSRDGLHEPYRLPLLSGAVEALSAAREAGAWSTNVSGAGSGLVCTCALDDRAVVADALTTHWPGASARPLEVILEAPAVQLIP
ncbi:MAG: homoserine kinase [Planctomycetota bacterium]